MVTNIMTDLESFIGAEILVLYKSSVVTISQIPSIDDVILESN